LVTSSARAATADAVKRAAHTIPSRIAAEQWASGFISNTLRKMPFCQ
jgi:hypothetical protein